MAYHRWRLCLRPDGKVERCDCGVERRAAIPRYRHPGKEWVRQMPDHPDPPQEELFDDGAFLDADAGSSLHAPRPPAQQPAQAPPAKEEAPPARAKPQRQPLPALDVSLRSLGMCSTDVPVAEPPWEMDGEALASSGYEIFLDLPVDRTWEFGVQIGGTMAVYWRRFEAEGSAVPRAFATMLTVAAGIAATKATALAVLKRYDPGNPTPEVKRWKFEGKWKLA